MLKTPFFILILICTHQLLNARETGTPDSLAKAVTDTVTADTLRQPGPAAAPVDWSLYWFTIRGNPNGLSDSSRFEVYRYDEHLSYNMTGWEDYFYHNHRYFLFDFLESAQPRYVSAANLLPHQTGIRLDGRLINDAINGMVNTRNYSPDIIQRIETDNSAIHPAGGASLPSDEINLTRFKHRPEDPFTRLKYFEGDFGYTDLDITFARRFRDNFAVELGGYNRDYDVSGLNSQNYRAGFHKQFGKTVDYTLQFQKNDTETFFDNVIEQQSYSYSYNRHELVNDLTLWLDEDRAKFWHIQAAYTHDRRTTDQVNDTLFFSRFRLYNYQLAADREFRLAGFRLSTSAEAHHEIVWGTSFPDKLEDSGMSGHADLEIPAMLRLTLRPALDITWQYGGNPQVMPGLEVHWPIGSALLRTNIYQSVRFPERLERSVSLPDVQGNPDLKPERLTNISSQVEVRPFPDLLLRGDLTWRRIADEIRFTGDFFGNGQNRSFLSVGGNGEWSLWRLWFRGGGQMTEASIHVTPETSAWIQAVYRDIWINGAVGVTFSGGYRWSGRHNRIRYHHGLERFYWSEDVIDGHQTLFYKLAATVKDAHLYFEMDNVLSTNYRIIHGYYESIRRIRFGVNWKLWN